MSREKSINIDSDEEIVTKVSKLNLNQNVQVQTNVQNQIVTSNVQINSKKKVIDFFLKNMGLPTFFENPKATKRKYVSEQLKLKEIELSKQNKDEEQIQIELEEFELQLKKLLSHHTYVCPRQKEVINTINSFYDLVEKIRAFGYGGSLDDLIQ